MSCGYAVALPISAIAVWLTWRQNFQPPQHTFVFATFQLARIAGTLGHLGAILWFSKSGLLPRLQRSLAAVGQTALSNYIAHSVFYAMIFYGHGLGLFDRLQRYQLYYVVLGLWAFSLIASPLWLEHYRFGPLEWCWRSLTYWKRQPMRLAEETVPTGALEPA
jgi:uncharacterized protein